MRWRFRIRRHPPLPYSSHHLHESREHRRREHWRTTQDYFLRGGRIRVAQCPHIDGTLRNTVRGGLNLHGVPRVLVIPIGRRTIMRSVSMS